MADEKNESKISVQDLPQEAEELTAEEAMEVKGGLAGDWNGDGRVDTSDYVTTANQPGRKRP